MTGKIMNYHPESERKCLFVVLGMHRSGTSAVVRSLLTFGVELGEKLDPTADAVNAKGYWEDMDVVQLNEEMLDACGLKWHSFKPIAAHEVERLCQQGFLLKAVTLLRSKLGVKPSFGFKDPRTAKLLPFWRKVFDAVDADVKYLLAYRNPLSVVDSLSKRDGFSRAKSLLLVAQYLVECQQVLCDENAVLVNYDVLMREPMQQLEHIAQKLELSILPDEASLYCDDFLDKNLRNSVYASTDLNLEPDAIALLKEVHAFMVSSEVELGFDQHKIQGWQEELKRWAAALELLDEQDACISQLNLLKKGLVTENTKIMEMVHERDARITAELIRVNSLETQLNVVRAQNLEREQEVVTLNTRIQSHEEDLLVMQHELQLKQQDVDSLVQVRNEVLSSTSWRITSPVRFLGRTLRFVKRVIGVVPGEVRSKGGVKPLLISGYHVWRNGGLLAIRGKLVMLERAQLHQTAAELGSLPKSVFDVLPLYLAPEIRVQEFDAKNLPKQRIAVHLHLFYVDLLDEFLPRLALIPVEFDLFVSIAQTQCADAVRDKIQYIQLNLGQLIIEQIPNRGRNLAPLIVQFGQRLSSYEVVGHFHSKKSPHNARLSQWCAQMQDALLGQPGDSSARIGYFFEQLAAGARFVYPQERLEFIKDPSGWGDNHANAKSLLEKYTDFSIDDFPKVEFPEGAMWWASGQAMQRLLNLPLSYDDFEPEPIAADGNLAHALERLIFVLANDVAGPLIRIEHGDSDPDYSWYESQQDFSDKIVHNDIKVLSYYLPQFHYTPENNEWHGNNFTEWTKVRAANPLFYQHYQQHIPHENIGYYLLDNPQTLKRQAEDMRQAGVHGQVFYHYWFTGRMILEKPAQMLLENKDINMPFCFCWANENWTRRWDGNENEILLGQDYSVEDALGFIRYLIPFFHDERYIRIDDRPVLFVYRPSSIPDPKMYQDIWAKECQAAGLKPPYVVAVLTRGASNPKDFSMDAATERVLNDWTGGNAPDIKHTLHAYRDINGSVIHYDDVASYYSGQKNAQDFTCFRNLVPQWDNTARYGSEAYVVHGSTPKAFQNWFKQLVDYSKQHLPEDRRFVIVNAWNEWAEGAHLEPDNRYGYSYLNSIGRVLSGLELTSRMTITAEITSDFKLHVQLPEHLLSSLKRDTKLAKDYLYGLNNALEELPCQVTVSAESKEFLSEFNIGTSAEADCLLEVRMLSFFAKDVLKKLLQAAQQNPESIIIANSYDNHELLNVKDNSCVTNESLYVAPLVLRPVKQKQIKNVFVRTDAMVFASRVGHVVTAKPPEVTTVIRVHAKADLQRLHNALGCLAAMQNCVCIPLITAQGLSGEQKQQLNEILQQYSFAKESVHVIHFPVNGKQDLRSKMLNEGLQAVKTKYATFLDYDDFVFNDAYSWLLERLFKADKAVAFGRVYATTYERTTGRFIRRSQRYEYGGSFEEFKRMNHAPLHSFMLDLSKLDVSKLNYFDEHKYMEDYYMTLQLFTKDNADWEGLKLNRYVGDYIHSVDCEHTLALVNDDERNKLLNNPVYLECESRIHKIRHTL